VEQASACEWGSSPLAGRRTESPPQGLKTCPTLKPISWLTASRRMERAVSLAACRFYGPLVSGAWVRNALAPRALSPVQSSRRRRPRARYARFHCL